MAVSSKALGPGRIARVALAALPLQEIEVRRWQENYDLALARKVMQRAFLA